MKKGKKNNHKNNKSKNQKTRLEVIHLDAIEANISTETSLVSLDITQKLAEDLRFNLFQVLYQQWNLVELSLRVDPLLNLGNSTLPFYAYLSYRGTDAGITADTVVTTGRRACTPLKGSTLNYRSNGRQNDFNYWFDTLDSTLPTLTFYLATPKSVTSEKSTRAVVVASVYFKVRFPTLLSTNVKLLKEIKSLRKPQVEESFIIEEEEEEDIKEQKKFLPYDEKKKRKK